MKKLLALCLTAVLCLWCFASCSFLPKIERFIPDEKITSVEIKTVNYETGSDDIAKKYVLIEEQSDEIKSLLNEITYAKRYNILKEKWTHVNDVKYVFTFETQKVCLSENHIYVYDNSEALLKHVEFNSSTFNNYLEPINEVLQSIISIKGIDNTAKIEVTQYDIGEKAATVTVIEEENIKHIVDNLTSLTLKKRNGCEPIALEYEITFYNKDGEKIRVIHISLDGLVDYNSVISGELDKTYLAGLFE